jgi:hypothetical protein
LRIRRITARAGDGGVVRLWIHDDARVDLAAKPHAAKPPA